MTSIFALVEKHASKRRSDINTNIIMLRSLSLKKDKSKNSTYILVNQVRRSPLFLPLLACLALADWRAPHSHHVFAMMIDDSHALTTFSFFLTLSFTRSLSSHHPGDRLRTGYIFKNQLDRKHRTRGQSQPRQLSNNGCERCSQGVKDQTSLGQPREQFSVDRVGMFNEKLWARFPRDDVE